jgi:hypothetical protein
MGVTPVDELGLIEQMCSLSSYNVWGKGWEVDGKRGERKRRSQYKTYILVGPWTLSDIFVLNSEPFKNLLDGSLFVSTYSLHGLTAGA